MKWNINLAQSKVNLPERRKAANYISTYKEKDNALFLALSSYVVFVLLGVITGQIYIEYFSITKIIGSLVTVIILFFYFWWLMIPAEILFLLTDNKLEVFSRFFGKYDLIITDNFIYGFEALSFLLIFIRMITAMNFFRTHKAIFSTTFYKLLPLGIFSIFILSLAAIKTLFLLNSGNTSFEVWIIAQSIGIMLFAIFQAVFTVYKNAQDDLLILNKLFGLKRISLILVLALISLIFIGGISYYIESQSLFLQVNPYIFYYIFAIIYSTLFFMSLKYFDESLQIIGYVNNRALNILSLIVLSEMIALYISMGFALFFRDDVDGGRFMLDLTSLFLFPIFALAYRNFLAFVSQKESKLPSFAMVAAYIVFVFIPLFVPILSEMFSLVTHTFDGLFTELIAFVTSGWFIVWIIIYIIAFLGFPPLVIVALAVSLFQFLWTATGMFFSTLWQLCLVFFKSFLMLLALIVVAYIVQFLVVRVVEYLNRKKVYIQILILLGLSLLIVAPVKYYNLTPVHIKQVHAFDFAIAKIEPSFKPKIRKIVSEVKYNIEESYYGTIKSYRNEMRSVAKIYLTMSDTMKEKLLQDAQETLTKRENTIVNNICKSTIVIDDAVKDADFTEALTQEERVSVIKLCTRKVIKHKNNALNRIIDEINKRTLASFKKRLKLITRYAKESPNKQGLAWSYPSKVFIGQLEYDLLKENIYTPNSIYKKKLQKVQQKVQKQNPRYYEKVLLKRETRYMSQALKVYKKYNISIE